MKRPTFKTVPPAVGEYIGRLETALKQTRENCAEWRKDYQRLEDQNRRQAGTICMLRAKVADFAKSF